MVSLQVKLLHPIVKRIDHKNETLGYCNVNRVIEKPVGRIPAGPARGGLCKGIENCHARTKGRGVIDKPEATQIDSHRVR